MLKHFYNLELLICDDEPKDALNAPDKLTEVSLCSRKGKAENFFNEVQPCNFKTQKKELLQLERYEKLLKDCNNVYLDLILET